MAKDCEQCLFTTFEQDGVYHIQCSGLVPGPGHVYCTLIVGEERALLIDNGFGDDDFAPYIRQLTDKPVTAVATHAHPDHIGGASQFDSIAISKHDFYLLPNMYGGNEYNEATCCLSKHTQVVPLEENQKFDLGGRIVTAIHTPGHTWGSTCYYDDKSKILMTGDTLNQHVFLFCATPAVPFGTYKAALEKLNEFDFDIFLGGHHPLPFKREWVNKMIEMINSFEVSKGRQYVREGMPNNIYMYVKGRGFGDPEYCGFMYNNDELDILQS